MSSTDLNNPPRIATNIVHRDEYQQRAREVSSEIWNVLRNHCGPTAQHAAWPSISNTGQMTDTEFSKDGISIVRKMEYPEDTLEYCIADAIAYVGERVNNSCHDGTTTSMMIMTRALSHLVNGSSEATNAAPHQLTKAIHHALDRMQQVLDDSVITADRYAELMGVNESEARRRIAYMQAMISSKGDKELAEALAELVSKVPIEKLHGVYNLDHRTYETEQRVDVVKYEAQLAIKTLFYHSRHYNHKLGTEYKHDDIDVIATSHDVIMGNPLHSRLKKMLSSSILALTRQVSNEPTPEGEEPVFVDPFFMRERDVLLYMGTCDPRVYDDIDRLNRLKEQAKMPGQLIPVQLMTSDAHAQRLYIRAMLALANQNDAGDGVSYLDKYIIPNVSVHFRAGFLYFEGLYERTESLYVSQFEDRENAFPDYVKLLGEIDTFIDDQKKAHNETRTSEAAFIDTLMIYRALVCQNWYSLKLGGSTHDLRALISVAEDTFGAVVSSMEYGFVFGGLWRMMAALHPDLGKPANIHEEYVFSVIALALREVLYVVYGRDAMGITQIRVKTESNGGIAAHFDLAELNAKQIDDMLKNPLHHLVYVQDDVEDYILCHQTASDITESNVALFQPVKGYYELIRRLRELLPKFATTATYITKAT